MHALALEFTYLWKLNRAHWHKVWLHICIWPQLWTGTSARTRAHTHTLNSWECLQCERVLRSPLRLTQWPMHCLCLHCTKLKQHSFPSPSPFKHTLRARFCEVAHTNPGRLGLRSHSENRGQVHWEINQNLRNAPDTFGPVFSPPAIDNVLAFQSGSQRY